MINTPPQVISGIEYSVCRPQDTPDMARLLAESFTQHDPPAVAVGLTPNEFEAFVELWSPAAGVDGLTVVARDVATGQLAGVLLTTTPRRHPRKDSKQCRTSSIRSSTCWVRSMPSTGM